MDFDRAAQRLVRDQSKLKQQQRQRQGAVVSSQAKREMERRKRQEQAILTKKRAQLKQLDYIQKYMTRCNRALHVQQLFHGNNTNGNYSSSQLQATSIYGDGDKIALPPSVLEYLANISDQRQRQQRFQQGNPWTFRIGILNPDYSFPQSKLLWEMQPPSTQDDDEDEDEDDDDDNFMMNDDNDDEAGNNLDTAAYLDELSHKYLAWTHGTVVEFTQEEGHVGLPAAVAAALIAQDKNNGTIPVTRTVDPAKKAQLVAEPSAMDDDNNNEKTPGHLAWGAFDVPLPKIEICLVQLPKGRACVLQPCREAVERGFYQLQDIKLVLEQSLIRTRAVLSVGDIISTWHRGVEYPLTVQAVTPPDYRAVICINTDLTVDFAAVPPSDNDHYDHHHYKAETTNETKNNSWAAAGGGYTLSSSSKTTITDPQHPPSPVVDAVELPPEPEMGGPDVCTVQIRNPAGGSVQRRFDISTATIQHLFALAKSTVGNQTTESLSFQLVTRFPRRVFQLHDSSSNNNNGMMDDSSLAATRTLKQVGIQAGRELFLMERLP